MKLWPLQCTFLIKPTHLHLPSFHNRASARVRGTTWRRWATPCWTWPWERSPGEEQQRADCSRKGGSKGSGGYPVGVMCMLTRCSDLPMLHFLLYVCLCPSRDVTKQEEGEKGCSQDWSMKQASWGGDLGSLQHCVPRS